MLASIRRLARDLWSACQNWQRDDGSHLAASVSFYMAVSFFPLLLVLISATGLVLRFSGWGQDAQQRLIGLIGEQTSSVLAGQVKAVLANVEEGAALGGPVGLAMLLVASLVVFVHFDDAMDRIWNVPRRDHPGVLAALRSVLVDRLRAFLMLLGVGVFVTAGFVATMGLSVVARYGSPWVPTPPSIWGFLTLGAAVVLNWLLFAVIYRLLPKVPVRWSEAARGALLASVMWEAGRRLLAALVIGSKFSVYGVVGAFVAIMLWVYYAVTVLFLGAEYIQTFLGRRHPAPPPSGE